VKALQLIAHGKPGTFELRNLPDPQPAADEVVVQVKACGLNHLDLWTEEGALPIPVELPRVTGCEIAGIVARVGNAVSGIKMGERVAVQSNLFCGQCEYCRSGEESNCLNLVMLGVQRDGGFAEQVVVPQRAVVRLPEAVDFKTSAALTLAGSTAMHMLTKRTQVRAGDSVLVIAAASGVGSAAIQIAKGQGARVITTGSSPEKRDLGTRLGADAVVDLSQADWPAQVRKITEKRGVDVVVEHVGGKVLEQAFNCLARSGTIVTCGATAGREVTLNLWPLFVKQQRLIGSYGRDSADLKATLEWAAAGKLKPVIDRTVPLNEVPQAFQSLRERRVLGKIVAEP
jgi:NADPH:quinone reductase-like Zn-dependent oxidoreductase